MKAPTQIDISESLRFNIDDIIYIINKNNYANSTVGKIVGLATDNYTGNCGYRGRADY